MNNGLAITWGIDNHFKTPYTIAADFSIQRECPTASLLRPTMSAPSGGICCNNSIWPSRLIWSIQNPEWTIRCRYTSRQGDLRRSDDRPGDPLLGGYVSLPGQP